MDTQKTRRSLKSQNGPETAAGFRLLLSTEVVSNIPNEHSDWDINDHKYSDKKNIFHEDTSLDKDIAFRYIEGTEVAASVPSGCYQSSNFRIAAVIRPEIVPARMLSTRLTTLPGCAVGFRLRRFSVYPITLF